MEKGLSTIIEVILILFIAISLTILVMIWLPRSTVKLFNEEPYNISYIRSRACVDLEDIDTVGKTVTLKNCGKVALNEFYFYVDGKKINLNLGELDPQDSVTVDYTENLTLGSHDIYIISDYAETPVVNFYVGNCSIYIYQNMIPYIIDQSNKLYCLAENVSINSKNAINFSSGVQNTVLDCRGYNIDGNDNPNTDGVYLSGSNLTKNKIMNCNITDFGIGIYLYNGPNSTTITNNMLNSNAYGLYLYSSPSNIITNNIANGNSVYGIYLSSSSNNQLTNNIVSNNPYGMWLVSSSNNAIAGGSISSNTIDYYLQSLDTTNNFINTNFTSARKIYFYDSTSWFNYENDTASSIWLETSISSAAAITRKLLNLNNTLMNWNDTADTSITATYIIKGLLPNTSYNVYDNNNPVIGSPISSDFSGQISFAITMHSNEEHQIRVEVSTFNGILWLRFNEGSGTTAFDSSGYGNNGTFYGETFRDGISYNGSTPTDLHTSSGKYGKALKFDGVKDYVNISGFSMPQSQFSVAMWFMRLGNSSCGSCGERLLTSGNPSHWGTELAANINGLNHIGVYQNWTDGTNTGWLDTGYAINNSNWYFSVLTWNGTNFMEYVYNNSAWTNWTSVSFSGKTPSSYSNKIGGFGSTSDGSFNGTIDEVRIWNITLSQAQIQAEMQSFFPVLRPVVSYSFEEPTGATYVNDTHIWVSGVYGSAVGFGGGADTLNVTNSNSLNKPNNTNQITVEGWIKITNLIATTHSIAQKGFDEYHGFWLGADVTDNQIYWEVGNGITNLKCWPPYNFANNTWYFIVGTYNGTYMNVYVNGTLQGSPCPQSTPMVFDNANLTSGVAICGCFAHAVVDNIRIYDRALSQAEIVADMNKG